MNSILIFVGVLFLGVACIIIVRLNIQRKNKLFIKWLEDLRMNAKKQYPNYKPNSSTRVDDCYMMGYRYALTDVIKKIRRQV